MVGNPESLVEESHGAAGLLEYPVYTKPPSWAELDIPEVLLSGHHARIERWRRDRALERTARLRPDMIAALDVARLDKHDLALLAELGWAPDPERGGALAPV
jgi:tRNA (guanine37-N1)-methyltransferase